MGAAIKDQIWNSVQVYKWGDLLSHSWMDFRVALGEVAVSGQVQGIVVKVSGANGSVLNTGEIQGVVIKMSPAIGSAMAAGSVTVLVSKRDYNSLMISYLPTYERQSVVFQSIMSSNDKEFRRLEYARGVIENNLDIDKAIEILPIYERDLGITTKKALPYEQRREMVKAKYQSAFGQTTEDQIISVAAAFSNGEVDVLPTDAPGVYQIKFVGAKGIPDNMDGLQSAIDAIVPAHLEFQYTYTFNAWQFLSTKTWGDASGLTWDGLRTYS